ncbi:6385_t:CDS:2, partial [Dentiscutata heterogama]
MTNVYITPRKLVVTGTIVPELHYGPYLRDWWIFFKESQNVPSPIPIRLGLEVMVQLNKMSFIIHVVRYIHSHLQPGYICEGGGQSSGIVTSSSNAIILVYQAIFGTKTKFAGLSYLGLEQTETSQKLLEGVVFYPFIIEVENLSIFVSSLGKISHSNQKTIGYNYTSSLFYKYKSKQSVFFQSVNKNNSYSIIVYQNSQIVAEYTDNSPNAVWCQTVSNQYTLADWNNKAIMEHLFDLHLKKAVSKSAKKWHQNEFWTNTPNPEKDRITLKNLYEDGILNVSPQTLTTKAFWDCFRDSYNINLKGTNGKVHILSIIAEKFMYQEIKDELK